MDTQEDLKNFDWDKDIDFFGENAPENMVIDDGTLIPKEEPKEEEPKKEEVTEEKEEKKTEEEIKAEEAFEDLVVDSEDSYVSSKVSYNDFYKKLVSENIIDDDEEDGVEITEEVLAEKIEAQFEKRFEDGIKDLPQELKEAIKFVYNGGEYQDFVSNYTKHTELSEDLDITDEDNQEKVLRYMLEKDETDKEIIESQIEFYKDSGKLESISTKYFNKWKKDMKAERENLIESQKEAKRQALENQKEFKKEISTFISKNNEIKGFSLNRKDENELPEYISNPTIKLDNGRQITPFYRDLFEALKDKENIVLLAKMVKDNFNLESFKKNIVTKQTKEIKDNLQRQQKSTNKDAHKPKRLVDLI